MTDLPQNLEAEAAVIGALMLDNGVAWDVFAEVSESDFCDRRHQQIFGVIAGLHAEGRPFDRLTIAEELQRRGQLTTEINLLLLDLFANSYGSSNAAHYARLVRDKAQGRALVALGKKIASMALSEPPSEVVSFVSQALSGISSAKSTKAKRFSEIFNETERAILEIRKRRESGQLTGAPTGIRRFDDAIGGLTGPRLIVIAARPATGKTALLNLAGVNAARNGFPGLIMSLEMSHDQLMIRSLAAEAGVNVTKLSQGYPQEWDAGTDAMARLGDIPLWIDTDTYDLDEICSQIALFKHRHGIMWAAVDHIGLVTTRNRFNSRNDQMGHISRSFKQLAKRLDIPLIALSQLSRQCEKDNRRPMMSDLRDSGNIEQDADIVAFIHTPYDERDKPTKTIEIGLSKNRGGRTGWIDGYQFEGATQRITEVPSNVVPFYKNQER